MLASDPSGSNSTHGISCEILVSGYSLPSAKMNPLVSSLSIGAIPVYSFSFTRWNLT